VSHTQQISNGVGGLPAGTLVAGDRFGRGIAGGAGDMDGDGLNDAIVSAITTNDGLTNGGAIYVLFLYGNDTVREVVRLSQAAGEGFDELPNLTT